MANVAPSTASSFAATEDGCQPALKRSGDDIFEHDKETIASRNVPDLQLKRLILKRAREINTATAKLFQVNDQARSICEDIERERDFYFDYVSIQLVDIGEQIIQTVHGSAVKGEWYKISRHAMEGDPKFLDIQACVAATKPPVIEIITGWDDRFDPFIYKSFGHQHFSRAFVPLIIARSPEGCLSEADPDQFRSEVKKKEKAPSCQITLVPKFEDPAIPYPLYEIIGTIEAGFDNAAREVPQILTQEDAQILFRHACRHAYTLSLTTLWHVLEVIARSAKEIASADFSSLHFPHPPHCNRNVYHVWAGRPLSGNFPRSGGLGEQAIEAGEPMFLPPEDDIQHVSLLRESNPAAYDGGTRAMAAFPLVMDEERDPRSPQTRPSRANGGVLYVGFRDNHSLSEDEKDGLRLFANLAKDAVRQATHYVQTVHLSRQLANLNDVSKALAAIPEEEDLLPFIAGYALNLLAADLTILYAYDPERQQFLSNPAVEGRRQSRLGVPGADEASYVPPAHLIADVNPKFAQCPRALASLYAADENLAELSQFVETEKIESGFAVPLALGKTIVGVMFVNYRRPRSFSRYEEDVIGTLASIAAVAIQNRRLLQARQDNVHAMTHQLRDPLGATKTSVIGIQCRLEDQSLSQEINRVVDQLDVLDSLCEGVFVSLSTEAVNFVAAESNAKTININDEIARLWRFLQLARGRSDMVLRIASDIDDSTTICMSRPFFINVIYSVLHNAIKYGDKDSELRVRWADVPGLVRIEIRSIGEPILPEERDWIFHKFFRGRNSPRRGVGLGLWVAHKLMKIAGGDIRLEWDPHSQRVSTFLIDCRRAESCNPLNANSHRL